MNRKENKTYLLIGSGNMARYLLAHQSASLSCKGIYSSNSENAVLLSHQYGIAPLSSLEAIANMAVDYIFLAVKDSAIASVFERINSSALFISFSGMLDEQQLAIASNKAIATLWPLYSINTAVKHTTPIPFIINNETTQHSSELRFLASQYSTTIIELSYEQRKAAHLAAVVLNNFVNHLYALTQSFCEEKQLDARLFIPLVAQTAAQYTALNAHNTQTGPAIRGDQDTIQKHLEILVNSPLEGIYSLLTESIKKSC